MNSGKTVATGTSPGYCAEPTKATPGSESWNPVSFETITCNHWRNTMQLSSRFANATPLLRADHPLSDDQIYQVAPSIYAEAKHQSRSERYTYIPTGEVLGAAPARWC